MHFRCPKNYAETFVSERRILPNRRGDGRGLHRRRTDGQGATGQSALNRQRFKFINLGLSIRSCGHYSKSLILNVPKLRLIETHQNVAALAAACDPVVAALGFVGGRADGAGHGASVRPAMV